MSVALAVRFRGSSPPPPRETPRSRRIVLQDTRGSQRSGGAGTGATVGGWPEGGRDLVPLDSLSGCELDRCVSAPVSAVKWDVQCPRRRVSIRDTRLLLATPSRRVRERCLCPRARERCLCREQCGPGKCVSSWACFGTEGRPPSKWLWNYYGTRGFWLLGLQAARRWRLVIKCLLLWGCWCLVFGEACQLGTAGLVLTAPARTLRYTCLLIVRIVCWNVRRLISLDFRGTFGA